jgi:hypothetical protein
VNDLSLGRDSSNELDQMWVAREEQHLVTLSGIGKRFSHGRGTGGIEVHENVVEDHRERLGALGKGLCKPQP